MTHDNTPATKADLEELATKLMRSIDERLERMDQRFERMSESVDMTRRSVTRAHDDIDRILNILVGQKTTSERRDERLTRLERRVGSR